MKDADRLLADVGAFAADLAAQRPERQHRRRLDPDDFRRLRETRLHLAAIPAAHGGLWETTQHSVRALCEALRLLGEADPSLALVASMHPGVLAFWRDSPSPAAADGAWEEQQRQVYRGVVDGGAWWGTISSEPGSGGDILRTRTLARAGGAAGHRITGVKHFGSGSGAMSYMLTIALPEGESEPAWFFLDVREVSWDGSAGMTLQAEWDGHGMAATNSHSFAFENFPATRLAWPGTLQEILVVGDTIAMFFTAVIVGIVGAAMRHMRGELARRGPPADTLRAFDKVEWVAAEREAWLVRQAYEAGLQALERYGRARFATLLAKTNVAALAESVLGRLCRLSGGSAFSRRSPLGFWFEDVRALGFLRPPWSLAQEAVFDMSWAETL